MLARECRGRRWWRTQGGRLTTTGSLDVCTWRGFDCFSVVLGDIMKLLRMVVRIMVVVVVVQYDPVKSHLLLPLPLIDLTKSKTCKRPSRGVSRKEKGALLTSKCSNVVNLEEEKQKQGGRGENQDRQDPVLLSPPSSLAACL